MQFLNKDGENIIKWDVAPRCWKHFIISVQYGCAGIFVNGQQLIK